MHNPKIAIFPQPAADKMPYPPAQSMDLGADEEAAIQSAQTFTAANGNTRQPEDPEAKAGRWHTPLLLIVAAIVGIIFILAVN